MMGPSKYGAFMKQKLYIQWKPQIGKFAVLFGTLEPNSFLSLEIKIRIVECYLAFFLFLKTMNLSLSVIRLI